MSTMQQCPPVRVTNRGEAVALVRTLRLLLTSCGERGLLLEPPAAAELAGGLEGLERLLTGEPIKPLPGVGNVVALRGRARR